MLSPFGAGYVYDARFRSKWLPGRGILRVVARIAQSEANVSIYAHMVSLERSYRQESYTISFIIVAIFLGKLHQFLTCMFVFYQFLNL